MESCQKLLQYYSEEMKKMVEERQMKAVVQLEKLQFWNKTEKLIPLDTSFRLDQVISCWLLIGQ